MRTVHACGESRVSSASGARTCIVNGSQLPSGASNVVDRGRLTTLRGSDDRLPGQTRSCGGRTRRALRPTAVGAPRSKSVVRRAAAGRGPRARSDRPQRQKNLARPPSGARVSGSAIVMSVPPAPTRAIERWRMSPRPLVTRSQPRLMSHTHQQLAIVSLSPPLHTSCHAPDSRTLADIQTPQIASTCDTTIYPRLR
jgi:hypothetical protein